MALKAKSHRRYLIYGQNYPSKNSNPIKFSQKFTWNLSSDQFWKSTIFHRPFSAWTRPETGHIWPTIWKNDWSILKTIPLVSWRISSILFFQTWIQSRILISFPKFPQMKFLLFSFDPWRFLQRFAKNSFFGFFEFYFWLIFGLHDEADINLFFRLSS